MSETPRVMKFEAVHNFRDLGGYRTADGRAVVKPGLVFRSARMDLATERDVATLERSLRTVVDLRDPGEIEDAQKVAEASARGVRETGTTSTTRAATVTLHARFRFTEYRERKSSDARNSATALVPMPFKPRWTPGEKSSADVLSAER